ncbi:hypothetical protein VTN49DRAFT_253 [Thermomyces lanuginosus]|uniref:uncharacterized protein n=1 Tax=Thermomyces lanuginosus TaxID=5541 RepID=UPI00374208D3
MTSMEPAGAIRLRSSQPSCQDGDGDGTEPAELGQAKGVRHGKVALVERKRSYIQPRAIVLTGGDVDDGFDRETGDARLFDAGRP